MVSSYRDEESNQRQKFALLILGVLLLFLTARFCWGFLRSPPQLAPAPEVFNTVDALFTAVTAKDAKRLAECEQRLKSYKDNGKLPAAAWKRLERVIATAHKGNWEPAAHTLYDFIQGQRGEGLEKVTHSTKVPPQPKAGKRLQPVAFTPRTKS